MYPASYQVALERKVDAVLADGASLESFEGRTLDSTSGNCDDTL